MAEAKAKKKSKFITFFKEVKSELKKVAWPDRKKVVNNTLIVIAAVVIIGAVIALLDFVFQLGVTKFIFK